MNQTELLPETEDSLISTYIGPQLKQGRPKKTIHVVNSKREPLKLDYGVMQTRDADPLLKPVVLVCGFGSGWRGIAELGFYLAKKRWRVYLVSLPGYGNSDDPYSPYYARARKRFWSEAEALSQFAVAMQAEWGGPAHWVGHSLGAAVITTLAYQNRRDVSKLVLLNPAGFERQNRWWLATKFALCGILHSITSSKKGAWRKLQPYLPKEQSPFSRARLSQRLNEWKLTSEDCASQYLEVLKDVPTAYVTGKKDFVFPYATSNVVAILSGRLHYCSLIALPLWHNTTMHGSDLTAEAIDEFLREQPQNGR